LVNQKIDQIEKKNNTNNQQSQVLFPLAKLHLLKGKRKGSYVISFKSGSLFTMKCFSAALVASKEALSLS